MIRVQGNKQYLPVPARVQWMRGDHPDWGIDTAVVKIEWDAGYAVMRAEVRDETGRIIGAGTKTETRKGFGDFVEKAETGAVGRALARAGYGTEDALDLEDERYADAPIEQPERDSGRSQAGRRETKPAETPAPAQRTPEEESLRDELLRLTAPKGHEYQQHLADKVGVEPGTRANVEQLRAMILLAVESAANEQPASEPVEVDAAASEVVPPSASDAPPPKPGTPEYGALQPVQKASARAYWSKHPEDEPTLAEQLKVTA
jgi:hypothetical protein